MEKYVSVQDDCFLATVIDGWGFETSSNEINAWDYQMADYVAVRERYSLFPRKSLVRNIGFMLDSTHCAEAPSWYTDNSYDFDVHALDTLVIDEAYTKNMSQIFMIIIL